MPREKKYVRTIAFRVTAEEWELIQYGMNIDGFGKPSHFIREELNLMFTTLRNVRQQDVKRVEAKAKRAAKKATADVNA